MKIVVNTVCGGFELPAELEEPLSNKGYDLYSWFEKDRNLRTEDILVKWVEEHSDFTRHAKVNNYCTLYTIDIPDEATDWMLNQIEGAEDVTYVVDGKLYLKWDNALSSGGYGGPANEKINKED